MQREEALRLVYDAIEVVNPLLPAGRRLGKSPDTVLVGPSGSLDSLGIINFVITLEERVGEAVGAPVRLLDETALIDDTGAFATVDTLVRFLEQLSPA